MGIATRGSTVAIGICFPVISGFLIALRFYTRHHQKTGRRIDDWLCIPAWIFLTGCCSCLLTGVFTDAFRDHPISTPDYVTPGQRRLAQVVFALVKLYVVANFFIKLSILFFYRRIFVGRVFNICSWVLIGFSCIWVVYAFIVSVLYCGTNVTANTVGPWALCPLWGFAIQMGTFCADTFIDLCLIILPIPFVWKLQASIQRKLVIVAIFMVGGFAFVASLINTIIQLVQLLAPAVAENGDFFKGSWLLFYDWPVVEIGVGLIACNLPVITYHAARSFLRGIQKAFASLTSSRSERHASNADTLVGTIGTVEIEAQRKGSVRSWYGSRRASLGYGAGKDNTSVIPLTKVISEDTGRGLTPDGIPTARMGLESVEKVDGTVTRQVV